MKEITITADEQELIFRGIRPDGMAYEVFQQARKQLQRSVNLYLGGKFVHVSVNKDPLYNVEGRGTYTRKNPKVLGKKNQQYKRSLK